MFKFFFSAVLGFALANVSVAQVAAEGRFAEISRFPAEIDPDCRGGRAKIYDECSDQFTLYQ